MSDGFSECGTVSRAQFTRLLRSRLAAHLYDDSGVAPEGFAIYSLSDPRDVRNVRYIGLTDEPRRRLLQHVNTARLWLPDERPWWVKSPQLRPLYEWIRGLHREQARLPVMVVWSWAANLAEARAAERARIGACLGDQLPLLNIQGKPAPTAKPGRSRPRRVLARAD